ncbi:ABC transporter permease [Olivibacter domesticus]|uniref:Duplicated orphan permease n=1 Tax=Olivibacter domesticus TaxID=407022 RepID=A0A1H7SDR8_OLID1|nr:ABC transporter permease [Olivibacter domesticus]SEL70811.1 duplicated orphan permease [Olivibacter domesticus]
MIKNYLKIAWRSLLKGKGYSFINIFGLALGLSCFMLISLWIRDELSYNHFLTDADRVYAVRINSLFNGEIQTGNMTPGPLEPALRSDIPEIEAVTKLGYAPNLLLSTENKSVKEVGWYASSDFFKVFRFKPLSGNPAQALASIDQIVITKTLALKHFNTTNAIGRTIEVDKNKVYTIGAVIDDIPENSTLQFAWLLNFKINEQDWMKTWGNNSFQTYVKLKPNTTAAQAMASMKNIYNRYQTDMKSTPILQPIKDIYLYGSYKNGQPDGGRIAYVHIFLLVALFILVIACVNFMNLATARSAKRAKEVGVLKTVGAPRKTLIIQFYIESLLTTLTAVILAFIFVWLFLPYFNSSFEKHIALSSSDPILWCGILVLVFFTTFIAGSYPAIFLSSFQPINILKGTFTSRNRGLKLDVLTIRKGLVVFQFTLSIFLIVSILVIGNQVNYIQNLNLGMDKENVLYVPLEGNLYTKSETFRQKAASLPSVVAASTVGMLPMNLQSTSNDLSWEGKDPNLQTATTVALVGYDFTKTMHIDIVSGRDFSIEHPADTSAYVINETAAKLMGMKDPVGKQINFWNGKQTIIGVMRDFHTESLHTPIKPLVLCFSNKENGYMMVRTQAGKLKEALTALSTLTKNMNPDYPFEYHFADETYEEMYKSEQQVNLLVRYFGALAIIISCMGLFALVSFAAEQRTKEISIRKVVGASLINIVNLLSKDFLKLVLGAVFIAFPLAFWAVNKWLNSFEYKIDLGWEIFVLAGAISLLIALLTVSIQAIKAALANPVNSLRNE